MVTGETGNSALASLLCVEDAADLRPWGLLCDDCLRGMDSSSDFMPDAALFYHWPTQGVLSMMRLIDIVYRLTVTALSQRAQRHLQECIMS